MKNFIFTLIIGWAVWKLLNALSSFATKSSRSNSGSKFNAQNKQPKEGRTSIKYQPPVNKKISDEEGEYVDYEDVE
jgi:hypothetical protein